MHNASISQHDLDQNKLKILQGLVQVDPLSWVQAMNGYRRVTPPLVPNMGWPASKQGLFLAVYYVHPY